MPSSKAQVLILLIGICFNGSLAVVNQNNDAASLNIEEESFAPGDGAQSPLNSADSYSSSPINSKDNSEARRSDFEATTPVFPLSAPSYDYSPSDLKPPEGENSLSKQSGYSYEPPATTYPIFGPPFGESNPVYGPPTPPSPPSPPPPPPRPSYGPPPQQFYTKYGLPSNPNFIAPAFQRYPAIKSQYAAPKPQYSPTKLNYRPFGSPFNLPPQYSSPAKLQNTYQSSLLPSPYGRPTKIEGSNLASKSSYNNLKSGSIHSSVGNEPHRGLSGNPAPPTPPVISYDGWRPMTGAELKDLAFTLQAAEQLSQVPQSYLGSNNFEIKPQLLSLPNNYYASSPLSSNNQVLSSSYEIPFDFVKSFSDLALTDNANGFGLGTLPISSFPTANQHLCDDSLSSAQLLGNSPPISFSGVLNDGFHGDFQFTEPLGLAHGIPSGKQIDGPKLQPKVPVKFRPPVPSGLLESIGKDSQQGVDHSSEFRGQTYIPPPIPEVSKSSEQTNDNNDQTNGVQQSNGDSQSKNTAYDANSAPQANGLKYESSSNQQYPQSFSSDFSTSSSPDKVNGLNEYPSSISFDDSALSATSNTLPGLPADQNLSHGFIQDILSAIEQQDQPSRNGAFNEKSEGLQDAASDKVSRHVVNEVNLKKNKRHRR